MACLRGSKLHHGVSSLACAPAHVHLAGGPVTVIWTVLHDFSTCMPACRDDSWLTTSHEKGVCALYGVCGHRKDHSGLDCPDNQPGSALDGQALQKLQDICPQLATEHGPDGRYCCTEEQIDTLSHQVVCHHTRSLAHSSMVK